MDAKKRTSVEGAFQKEIMALLFDWSSYHILCVLLLTLEAALGIVVLTLLPDRYTEIDWIAYMQEVEGWLGGETNYTKLRGDTGPLVYPAGFVYLYSGLRALTGGGKGAAAVKTGQWLFLAVYLVNHALLLDIYGRTRPGPPWSAGLLSLSKRFHSLYILRLFNDCWAMLGVHACIAAATRGRWLTAGLLLSAGVSVKMNGLLLAPAFGLLLLRNTGVLRTTWILTAMIGLQAALGAPFLTTFPADYMGKAFEMSRVFFHTWTVNWKFIPEEIFISRQWSTALLVGHLGVLAWLAITAWTAMDGGLFNVLSTVWTHAFGGPAIPVVKDKKNKQNTRPGAFTDGPAYIAYLLWACNFVGIAFARTLHYQFLSWYWPSLPFLLWRTRLPTPFKLCVLAAVEYAFNVGDASGAATPASSAVLQAAHALLLVGLVMAPDAVPSPAGTLCPVLEDEEGSPGLSLRGSTGRVQKATREDGEEGTTTEELVQTVLQRRGASR